MGSPLSDWGHHFAGKIFGIPGPHLTGKKKTKNSRPVVSTIRLVWPKGVVRGCGTLFMMLGVGFNGCLVVWAKVRQYYSSLTSSHSSWCKIFHARYNIAHT